MVIKEILEKSDALFAEGKHAEAAAFLEGKAVLAQNQEEWKVELSIINELMGYYRGISQLGKRGITHSGQYRLQKSMR